MLTKEQIDEIRARAEASTPGPWGQAGAYVTNRDPDSGSFRTTIEHRDELGRGQRAFQAVPLARWEDAAFIAHARTDVPTLLEEVERLRAEKALTLAHLRDKAQRCADNPEDRDTAADMLREAADEIEAGDHLEEVAT